VLAIPAAAMLHAFVSVDAEGALREAHAQDGRRGGSLRGIPIAIKDIFDVAGVPTGNGSRAYADAPPAAEDATAVARLRGAGAVLVGKTATSSPAGSTHRRRAAWDSTAARGLERWLGVSRCGQAVMGDGSTPAAPSAFPRRTAGWWG
jgi:Asp-tRNA(Asn)/Glu-tRNA(Gln) amidotransferase A subunit family amidase